MFSKIIGICLILISISSCSTSKLLSVSSYYKGIVELKKGDKLKYSQYMNESCQDGLDLACYHMTKAYKVDFTKYPRELSFLQGMTSSSEIAFNFVSRNKPLQMFIFDNKTNELVKSQNISIKTASRPHSEWVVHKVFLKSLNKDSIYRVEVFNNKGEMLDIRMMATYKGDKSKKDIDFVVGSCMSDSYPENQLEIWKSVESIMPSTIFLIGDSVYTRVVKKEVIGDKISHQLIWDRYVSTRNALYLYKYRLLIPIYATWDDGEYGMRSGDKSFENKEESASIFHDFYENKASSIITKQGKVSFQLSFWGQNFFFLNNRSFRDSKKEESGTHFGYTQEIWLYNSLKKSIGPSWVISGDQFFGGHHPFDSYEGQHPESFRTFMTNLRSSKSPVVLLSGDRHFSEIQRIDSRYLGYQTYEITSSGLHTYLHKNAFKKEKLLTKNIVTGVSDSDNFVYIRSSYDKDKNQLDLNVQALGPKNKLLFEENLSIKK